MPQKFVMSYIMQIASLANPPLEAFGLRKAHHLVTPNFTFTSLAN